MFRLGKGRGVRRDPQTGRFISTNPYHPPALPKPYRYHARWRGMTCKVCGAGFEANRKDARYCSPACRDRAYRDRITARDGLTASEQRFLMQLDRYLPDVAGFIRTQPGIEAMRAAIQACSKTLQFASSARRK